ncbi:hypothetical protein P7K49_035872, partial [Saguinus oedipus]
RETSECSGLRGQRSGEATAPRGESEPKSSSELPAHLVPGRPSRLSHPLRRRIRPQNACRCARKTSHMCPILFKGPPLLVRSCLLLQPCPPGAARLSRVLESIPPQGAAAVAWASRACSGFSWLSSHRGSSVSWEREHEGGDTSRAGKTSVPRCKAGGQKRDGRGSARRLSASRQL